MNTKLYINKKWANNVDLNRRIKSGYYTIDYVDISDIDNYYVVLDQEEYKNLVSKGIAETHIIPFFLFKNTSFDEPLSKFSRKNSYNAIFMGTSHSQCSISESKLTLNYLMMSRPSLDLFCHLNNFKKIHSMLSRPKDI